MLVVRGSAPLRPSDPISTSKLIRYFVAEWHDLDTLHGRRAPMRRARSICMRAVSASGYVNLLIPDRGAAASSAFIP